MPLAAITAVAALAGALSASAGAPASQPLAISVSPAIVAVQVGQHHYSETITVRDAGTKAIRVSPSVQLLSQGGTGPVLGAGPSWAGLTSMSGRPLGKGIKLQPGDSLSVRFLLDAPATAHSVQDVGANFSASVDSAGTATVGGSVVSRVVLRLGGTTAVPNYHTRAVKAAPKSSSHALPLAGGLAGLLGLCALAVLWIRRRRTVRS